MLQTIEKPIQSIPGLVSQSLEGQIGNTPLLHLARTAVEHTLASGVRLYAKAEWFNPGGSIKDRAALNIIRTAEENGLLRPGMTLLDSTSGNTGIAYGMLGAARGYHVKLTVPGNVSPERMAILRAYGAELILTDPLEGSDGALLEARRLAAEDPTLFYANQYNNAANWRAHYLTTANEIWQQTDGAITHFVAGLGTGNRTALLTRSKAGNIWRRRSSLASTTSRWPMVTFPPAQRTLMTWLVFWPEAKVYSSVFHQLRPSLPLFVSHKLSKKALS
jgi:cysteine synthase B